MIQSNMKKSEAIESTLASRPIASSHYNTNQGKKLNKTRSKQNLKKSNTDGGHTKSKSTERVKPSTDKD